MLRKHRRTAQGEAYQLWIFEQGRVLSHLTGWRCRDFNCWPWVLWGCNVSIHPKSSLFYLIVSSFNSFRLEAAYCGCLPVAPNKLVYPEIYPDTSLYNTSNQLIKMLYNWCKNRHLFERDRAIFYENFDFDKYSAVSIVPKFISMIRAHLGTPGVVNGV